MNSQKRIIMKKSNVPVARRIENLTKSKAIGVGRINLVSSSPVRHRTSISSTNLTAYRTVTHSISTFKPVKRNSESNIRGLIAKFSLSVISHKSPINISMLEKEAAKDQIGDSYAMYINK